MTISLAATLLTVVGHSARDRADPRSDASLLKPIITVAGFGQAAPAIGLIALGAVLFGIGQVGASSR